MSETTGMAQHEVTRTLVKSQPEIWTQCSDADSLGRHMSGSFGEIRITRLEPEHSVAWEGEEVSGTVRIEPSAWGTRVTLTAEVADEVADLEAATPPPEPEVVAEPEAVAEPEPVADPEPEALAEPVVVAEPEPEPVVEPEHLAEEAADPPAVHAEAPSPKPEAIPGIWTRFRARFRRPAVVAVPAVAELRAEEKLPVDEQWPEEQWPYEEAADVEPSVDDKPVMEEPVMEEPVVEEPTVPRPVAHEAEVPAEPAVEPAARPDTDALLTAALESLGQAHHRPFSRA